MSLVTWTAGQFSTAVDRHDLEHQHVFQLLNRLYECIAQEDRRATGIALDGLVAFLEHHFSSEEASMTLVRYHALGRHRREHQRLIAACQDLQKQFRDGRIEITLQTTAFLRDWLTRHVSQVDRMYGPALAAGGIR